MHLPELKILYPPLLICVNSYKGWLNALTKSDARRYGFSTNEFLGPNLFKLCNLVTGLALVMLIASYTDTARLNRDGLGPKLI